MDSKIVYLKVNKEDIYLICPYFEAFEGMVAIRTPKPTAGPFAIIKLMVSPFFENDFEKILCSLINKLLTPPRPLDSAPLSIENGEGNEFDEVEERGEDV